MQSITSSPPGLGAFSLPETPNSEPQRDQRGLQDFLQATQGNLEDLRAKTLASFSVGALPNTTTPLPVIFAPACVAHEIIDSLLFDTSKVCLSWPH